MRSTQRPRARWPLGLLLAAMAALAAAAPCGPAIVADASGRAASLRWAAGAAADCRLDEAAYRAVVRDWLATLDPAAPAPRALALGRAEQLPWLASAMADAAADDPPWRALGPRAVPATHNRLVADLLSRPALRDRLAAPFDGTRHRVVAVTVEKVLVGPAVPGGPPLPYDAQVWLRLGPQP
jgi:hypothetical protein